MDGRQILDVARKAVARWSADRAPSMGAALSYYTVFSIAPLLLIVIAVAGLVFGADAARGAIVEQLAGLLGPRAAQTLQDLLQSASEPKEGVFATVIGAVLLLVGATTVLAELQDDLDRIWEAPPRADASGPLGWLRARLLSFAMILGLGFLLLVSLVASAAIAALGTWWGPLFSAWETLAHAVDFVVAYALITVLFALIYRFMPHVRIAWHDVWVGAAVTALLFSIGKQLIGLYIGKSSVVSAFGAAGSLAVLLLWVYYSAQIFLLGAEFTRVTAQLHGSHSPRAQGCAAEPVRASPAEAGIAASTIAPGAAAAMHGYEVPEAAAFAPAPPRRLGKLAAGIEHRPLSAIGVAAVLGALTAWWLRHRQRGAAAARRPPRWRSGRGQRRHRLA